jgi:hypothetical protein
MVDIVEKNVKKGLFMKLKLKGSKQAMMMHFSQEKPAENH